MEKKDWTNWTIKHEAIMGLSYEDLTNGIFRNISKDEDIRI